MSALRGYGDQWDWTGLLTDRLSPPRTWLAFLLQRLAERVGDTTDPDSVPAGAERVAAAWDISKSLGMSPAEAREAIASLLGASKRRSVKQA